MGRTRIESPVYQQIAVDLASKIVSGKYSVGERIRGRSTLAGHYNVSPETIRKAVCILEDVGIVSVQQGIGIEVLSWEKAQDYIEKYNDISSLQDTKKEILQILEEQRQREHQLKNAVNELIDATERFQYQNPFSPYELLLTEDMLYIGKTVGEINFWQNTAATIVAIRKEEKIILSPGPYATLRAGDTLFLVGSDDAFQRVKRFLRK